MTLQRRATGPVRRGAAGIGGTNPEHHHERPAPSEQ
jgi:hypothetical protein